WRMGEGSAAANADAKPYAFAAGLRAVQQHCDRIGLDATVEMSPLTGYHRVRRRLSGRPSVSAIVPTGGARGPVRGASRTFVGDAIRIVEQRCTYPVHEWIVVADHSTLGDVVDELAGLCPARLRVVWYDDAFNFAAKVNLGAAHATGEYLWLLNDDVELI